MTIVSIRGTHGSGKSTIIRKILDKYPHEASYTPGNTKRPAGYLATLPSGPLYIPGPYVTACGGCDAINPYSGIWPLIDRAAQSGYHVLFEGALVSSSYGSIGQAMNNWATQQSTDCVFAFLDTPLDKCLSRIAERRQKAWVLAGKPGTAPPVNPANTEGKHASVERTKLQMVKLGSAVRQVPIDHTKAVTQVLRLLGVKLTREPA